MRKYLLWAEFVSLFLIIPLVYYFSPVSLPKIPLLLAFFLGCLIYLRRSHGFDNRDLFDGLSGNMRELRMILLRSLAVFVASIGAVMLINPDLLFGFPKARPWLWLLVMGLYPLLSAYPQELIYRSFMFHRYQPIFRSEIVMVAFSVLSFAFLHIIFDNWLAVVLTIPAGYLFTRTYLRTGSLLLASLEHALYGCIIFTVGLGRFFYNPG